MSRLINISDKTYKRLKELKRVEDSFTNVIDRLLETVSNSEEILKYAGTVEFSEEKINDIKKGWKKWPEKYV